MTFCVTALDKHKRIHYLTYQLDSLEANLNVIHVLRTRGHSLLSVQLIDRNRVSDLPVEMFYDVLATIALDELETEWKAILTGPPISSLTKKQKISRWGQEWVSYIEEEIIKKDISITKLETALQIVVNLDEAKLLRPQNNTVIDRYNSVIKNHGRQLIKLYTIRYRLLNGQDAAAVLE